MLKKFLFALFGLILGIGLGYSYIFYLPKLIGRHQFALISPLSLGKQANQVIGFLPYWLIDQAKSEYPKYVTTLTYFGLRVDTDGSIMQLATPTESEPGWYALKSGKLDSFFDTAKKNNVSLSLLIASGDQDAINTLVASPTSHGKMLVSQVVPIMKKYGFTDLNLDIESVQDASDEARINFIQFTQTVKKGLTDTGAGTLTVEISPADLLHKRLIDPKQIAPIADYIVLMAYDFHYIGSRVTGPVAPLYGAGKSLEYDTDTATVKALELMPSEKVILGVPVYGYEWETLTPASQSATIPSTGLTASDLRIQNLLSNCSSCSASFDQTTKETLVNYRDEGTGTYHQIAYPDKQSMSAKIAYANSKKLGGLALWALGYEDTEVLTPLEDYLK